ncbi:MAG: RHS repeat-associated core domain-containing protein [Candidatus Acidiferrales bacterium]
MPRGQPKLNRIQNKRTTRVTYLYGVDHKFTGKERDSESGLDNFGARYHSSQLGRFMSPDPQI